MSTLLTIAGSVGDFLATVPQQVIAQVPEIGRASCRERVSSPV